MEYPGPLVEGRLIRRYKRFFADVELNGEVVTAHLANTGRMTGCWAEGAPCRLSMSTDPNRKLKFSVEQTCIDGRWIVVNTARPNRIVEEALLDGRIEGLSGEIRREVALDHGRVDFRVGPTWVEVKNATLWEAGVVWFPDTVTERGTRHLQTLTDRVRAGEPAMVVLHVGTEGVTEVRVARHLDPAFADAMQVALEAGVVVRAYQVVVSATSVTLGDPVRFTGS